FFQAEDGIRDFHVTGVQTCALPIYFRRHDSLQPRLARVLSPDASPCSAPPYPYPCPGDTAPQAEPACRGRPPVPVRRQTLRFREIGRASCREEWRCGEVSSQQ